MENTALILIIITLFLLVIIVGLLTVLIYKLMKQKESPLSKASGDASPAEFHPAIVERMKGLEKVRTKKTDLFCPNHPEEPGEVLCAICDTIFCKSCIKPYKSMHVCREHLALVMRYDWEEVLTLKTSTTDPEQGVKLYDVKKELFLKEDLPTYVETHYKINVDQDHIETYLVLFGIKENVDSLKEKLKEFI